MIFSKTFIIPVFLGIFTSLAQGQQENTILPGVQHLCFDITAAFATVTNIDGVSKEVITINGQFPGPTIRAKLHDTVTFRVRNNLVDGNGKNHSTTVHFHGLEQRLTPWWDGPELVTQCPIPVGEVMEYTFTLHQEGTYWYHSHSEWQYIDGFWGFFIVESSETSVEVHEYDDELMISLMDWHWHTGAYLTEIFHRPSNSSEPTAPFLVPGQTPIPDSILINSRGNANCARALEKGFDCSDLGLATEFKVTPGQTYRIRVLNPSARASFLFSINGHRLRVIEVDGVDTVETDPVDVVEIWPAQRYSFLVTMNATQNLQQQTFFSIQADMIIGGAIVSGVGPALATLWYENLSLPPVPGCSRPASASIMAMALPQRYPSIGGGSQGRPACGKIPSKDPTIQRGQFHFDTSSSANPSEVSCMIPTVNMEPSSARVPSSCVVDLSTRNPNPVLLNQMDCIPYPSAQCEEEDVPPETVDHRIILTAEFDTHPNQTDRWYFSDISFNLEGHDFPALFHSLGREPVPRRFSPQSIPLEQNIEVIINNLNGGHHPYHLHGHTFWVMGTGEEGDGAYHPERDAWKIANTTPIKRDTTHALPWSWTVVRFRSDNPGTWLMHCHIHWHFDTGLAVVFVEGGDDISCRYQIPQEARRVCCLNGIDIQHETRHCEGEPQPLQEPQCEALISRQTIGDSTLQDSQDGTLSNFIF